MNKTPIDHLDVLLFRAGNFYWGIPVESVVHVFWGVSGEDLQPLETVTECLCFGTQAEYRFLFGKEWVPAVPLLSSTELFEKETFHGAAIVLQEGVNKMAILADEIIGTVSLNVNEQIHLPPNHLNGVFRGRGIWGIAEEGELMVYLIEWNGSTGSERTIPKNERRTKKASES